MRRLLILLFFTIGCTSNQEDQKLYISNQNFSDDLTFEEFKIKLEEYGNNSSYPNIDK